MERFKSWALWTAIAALVVFCVKEFAGIDIAPTVDGLMNVLLPVLVAFGIVNNPTDRNNL
jgi:uncharacterized membrane protein